MCVRLCRSLIVAHLLEVDSEEEAAREKKQQQQAQPGG